MELNKKTYKSPVIEVTVFDFANSIANSTGNGVAGLEKNR